MYILKHQCVHAPAGAGDCTQPPSPSDLVVLYAQTQSHEGGSNCTPAPQQQQQERAATAGRPPETATEILDRLNRRVAPHNCL